MHPPNKDILEKSPQTEVLRDHYLHSAPRGTHSLNLALRGNHAIQLNAPKRRTKKHTGGPERPPYACIVFFFSLLLSHNSSHEKLNRERNLTGRIPNGRNNVSLMVANTDIQQTHRNSAIDTPNTTIEHRTKA